MSIYKRGEIWWARFTTPGGRRVQASCRTTVRIEAQEYHDQLKARCWREDALGEAPAMLWEDAVVRWLKESEKKSIAHDRMHIRLLEPYLLGKTLPEITREDSDRFIADRQKQVKPATINRSLEVLRAILNRAEKGWDWLERAPSIRLLKEPKRRIRWITQEQAAALLAELPRHLEAMARFTLCTGLRESNVTGLRWDQVDMKAGRAWIHPDQAKTKKAIGVPLSQEAVDILKAQEGRHPDYVFAYGVKVLRPVRKASTRAWREACERAKIKDFRWHDLRHTWASWHVQRGTPLHVLQELGGWESYEMVRRYAHLSVDHLADFAGNSGTNLVQLGQRRKNATGRKE